MQAPDHVINELPVRKYPRPEIKYHITTRHTLHFLKFHFGDNLEERGIIGVFPEKRENRIHLPGC